MAKKATAPDDDDVVEIVNLEKLFANKGRTVYFVAKESGLSTGQLYGLIKAQNNGERINPSIGTLSRIARALNVRVRSLIIE